MVAPRKSHDFFAFLIAGIALNLVPGQDTLYILGRSLAQGRMAPGIDLFSSMTPERAGSWLWSKIKEGIYPLIRPVF